MQVHFSGMDPKFLSNSQKSIFDSKGLSASLFLVGFSALSLWWIDLFYHPTSHPLFFFFFFPGLGLGGVGLQDPGGRTVPSFPIGLLVQGRESVLTRGTGSA